MTHRLHLQRLPIRFPVAISCRTFVNLCTRQDGETRTALVEGFTTRTLQDAGGASVRIAIDGRAIEQGAYMCAVRCGRAWLAAFGAIRRSGQLQACTAEVMVLGQPIFSSSQNKLRESTEFAPLSEPIHRCLFPCGSKIELRVIQRLRPFSSVHSVGGNWLMQLLCKLASEADNACLKAQQTQRGSLDVERATKALLGAGLQLVDGPDPARRTATARL